VDSYVDAKDQVNNWCVAQVVDADHDQRTVKLHFEGWSSRYDIEVKRNSTKIAPFRTYSIGYTGQQKSAFREYKFNPSYTALLNNKMKEVITTNFKCFKRPYEVTQFMRGEFFYYLDSLLTMQTNVEKTHLDECLAFCDIAFQLILKWYE
jgi:hypothetical protein